MNRHQLLALDGFEVVVGFDRPMRTYFAQVYDAAGENVLDRGDALAPLGTPDQAIDAVRAYATEIPPGLADDLHALAHPAH